MAISLTQLGERLKRAADVFRIVAPQIVRQQAQTGQSIVIDRNILEGIEVDGAKQQYSQKEHYRSGFAKAALNAAGTAWAGERGKKGTWEQFKTVQGRGSTVVNLSYTNRMYTAMHVVDAPSEGNVISAFVAISDREALAKYLGNVKRYGEFMRLRDEEVRRLRGDAQAELTDTFKRAINHP